MEGQVFQARNGGEQRDARSAGRHVEDDQHKCGQIPGEKTALGERRQGGQIKGDDAGVDRVLAVVGAPPIAHPHCRIAEVIGHKQGQEIHQGQLIRQSSPGSAPAQSQELGKGQGRHGADQPGKKGHEGKGNQGPGDGGATFPASGQ